MAIIDKNTLFDNEHLNGAKWSFGVPLERTNPVPIDKWSTFKTYADAVEFVNRDKGNIAYPGQIITIEGPDNVVDVYVVDRTATDCLKKLASGGSADEIAARVRELSSQLLSADGIIDQLSAAHDALSTALSTEISAETIAREANDVFLSGKIDALSDGISADVDALSTALSIEISAEVVNRTKAVEALSTALSTDLSAETINRTKAIEALSDALSIDIDALSAALSTEISAETKARTEAIKALEDKLSSAWQFRGVKTAVPTDNTEYKNGDVIIVNKDFTDLDGSKKTAAIEYAFDGTTWQQLGDESSGVSKYELKTAIDDLSATVSAEIDADVEALSTSLSNTVDAKILDLSTNLSTEISAEAIARDEAVKALSTALSTEISALNINANKAVEALSTALSTDIDDLSTALSTEISAEAIARNEAIEALSTALSTDLSTEIKARQENDAYLSTKIDAKIYAQVGDNAKPVSVDTMTMHKISAEKYAELLKTEGGIVETDLYVISSNYIDGYGEKVKNVADGEEATDAATYGQVIKLSTALSNDVKLSVQTLEQKIETAVEGGVKALSSELLTPTTGVIPVLGVKVDTLSTNLSNEIKALSSALSGDVDKLSADVYKDLSVAMTTTAGASDDVLSTFTFTQNGKTVGTINLPKDKVIESAKVVFGELSADGTFTPDKAGSSTASNKSKFYLEVVVANQKNKLYIPVPELADTYVGHSGDRIAITVQSDDDGARCISADIVNKSITNDRMANDSITMRNLSGEFIFNCGNAFGYTV